MQRRDFCKTLATAAVGAAGLALSATGLTLSAISPAHAQQDLTQSRDILLIHQLLANFHLAKTTQDIDLMMSLYTDDAAFHFGAATYTGQDAIRAFLLTTGSFTHQRFSLSPTFKTKIDVNGAEASFYFECFDVGSYDTLNPPVVSVLFGGGTAVKVGDQWLFSDLTGGKALPISIDQDYFP
jgi:hypothetical protein